MDETSLFGSREIWDERNETHEFYFQKWKENKNLGLGPNLICQLEEEEEEQRESLRAFRVLLFLFQYASNWVGLSKDGFKVWPKKQKIITLWHFFFTS